MKVRYADTVPIKDKKDILDMYYGRSDRYAHTYLATDIVQIAKKMKGKYTLPQIRSIIRAEYE